LVATVETFLRFGRLAVWVRALRPECFADDLALALDFGFGCALGRDLETWRRAVFFGRPAFTPLSLIGPAAPLGTIK